MLSSLSSTIRTVLAIPRFLPPSAGASSMQARISWRRNRRRRQPRPHFLRESKPVAISISYFGKLSGCVHGFATLLPLIHGRTATLSLVVALCIMRHHCRGPVSGDCRYFKRITAGVGQRHGCILTQAVDRVTIHAHLAQLLPHHDAETSAL